MRVGTIGVWIRYKDLDRLNDQEFAQFWSLMATAKGIKRQQRTPPVRPTPDRVADARTRVENFDEEFEDADLVAGRELPDELTRVTRNPYEGVRYVDGKRVNEPPRATRSCGCQVNAPHICGR